MNTNIKKSFGANEIVRRGQFSLEAAQKVLAEGYTQVTINRDGQPSLVSKDGLRINVWDYPRTYQARTQIVAWCTQAGLAMTGAGAPAPKPVATVAPAPKPVVAPAPVAAEAAPAVKFEEIKPAEPKAKKAKAPKAKKEAKPRKVKAEAPKKGEPQPGDELNALFDSFDSGNTPPEPDFGPDIPGVTINW